MSPPSIVILTNERDFAADTVVRRLHELGAEITRINIEDARTRPVPSWSPADDADVSRGAVVWWRQFETDDAPTTLAEVDDLLVERAQWRTWVSTLAPASSVWVNPVWAARRAENKVEQLRLAHRLGFDVPATLVTNSSEDARAFAQSIGPCVVKTLTSGYFSFSDRSFVFTELLDDDVLSLDGWSDVPVIIQASLAGALDARIVSFGDKCFGARCQSKGVDWRKTPYEADLWRTWDVPDHIRRLCNRYREALSLEYAAFDFMLSDDGIFFLEANQAGEWLFLDRALDLGISDALADRFVVLGGADR